jgi:hypothetical protein
MLADVAGFKDLSFKHVIALPLRRQLFADWFRPIAQIEPEGRVEWALESVAGDTALDVGFDRKGMHIPVWIYEAPEFIAYLKQANRTPEEFDAALPKLSPIPAADLPAADAAVGHFDLGRRFVSRFVAQSDGELFLYVNDAVFGYPSYRVLFGHSPLGVFKGFYDNNSGKATVTIKRIDAAPAPAASTSAGASTSATR